MTAPERTTLDAWYAHEDQEEAAALRNGATPDVAALRSQVANAVQQSRAITERLHTLTEENALLREEIAGLQRQLAAKLTAVGP